MKKGTILRVPQGTELSPKLLSILKGRFPDCILEPYHEKPDYQQSFAHRINSLHSAFLFILEAYPLPSESVLLTRASLKNYADACKEASKLADRSVDEMQEELRKFTAQLIGILRFSWKLADVKKAVELLNEAEQFVLMRQGRFDLATLMPMQFADDTLYVIQWDESLPPYYDLLLNELKQIKAEKYPKTPSWLRGSEEYQQAYFCNLDAGIVNHAEMALDFKGFLKNWASIKNKAIHLVTDLQHIHKNALPFPSWFNKLSVHHREMIRVLAADPANLDNNLKQFKQMLYSDELKQKCTEILPYMSRIPQWYWVLPEHQQFFLEWVLQSVTELEDAVSFLPSRHRTFPLPANFAAHSLLAIRANGEIYELLGKRYRSSHIASRDELKSPKAVQQRHCDANLDKVMERAKPKQLVLFQTLISPIHAADYVPSCLLPTLPPDLELYHLARSAVQRRQKEPPILQNNHPYNKAKRLYYTKSNDKDCLYFLDVAQQYIASTPVLQTLIDQYKRVLGSPAGSATFFDYNGRELFLSSLEQLITENLEGYSYGCCVSGKDRKAIEIMHTDAMKMYEKKYGCWPVFDEPWDTENRKRFVMLVADVYMTRHQHEHAGQNAPGSEGIKTPAEYFPKDIVEEIDKRLDGHGSIADDDRLATNNEVKNIFIGGSKKLKDYLLPEVNLLCQLVARQLGEVNCTKLYDTLNLLINEKGQFVPSFEHSGRWPVTFFSDNKEADCPEGIKLIRDLMLDPMAGNDNVLRIEKILIIVLNRPKTDSTRTAVTNSVYDRLRALCEPESHYESTVAKTIEEWTALFNLSKDSHTQKTYGCALDASVFSVD